MSARPLAARCLKHTTAARPAALLCALALAWALAPAPVQAKGKRDKQQAEVTEPKPGARGVRLKPPPRVTYANGQTAAQRQRSEAARLRRECKGLPDAGACRGYGRK